MKPLCSAAAILILLPALAYGLAGPLSGPSLGYRADLDERSKARVAKALKFMNDEMKFIEGNFINEFSHFTLAGSMDDAASAIWLIREAGAWKVTVALHEFDDDKLALAISQNASTATVDIKVNSGRKDFRKDEFERFIGPEDETLKLLNILVLSSEELEDAAATGRELAEADRRSGRARILQYGQPRISIPGEKPVDKASGLPIKVAAGCVVSKSFVEVVDAYNEAMREAQAKKK